MGFSAKLREVLKKYGKVAVGVHCSVSAVSITSLYVAIKNKVDVESLFEKVGLPYGVDRGDSAAGDGEISKGDPTAVILEESEAHPPGVADRQETRQRHRNRMSEMAASSGGALALALLCNKALFPLRVPITIALTPPITRFLARRNLIKKA